MHAEIPYRHFHQNDPGVVPNLLQTGSGSPTGICVYEGNQLPEIFHNQIIHCDAGPSIVRAYVRENDGAGYKAEMVKYFGWYQKQMVPTSGRLCCTRWFSLCNRLV